MYCQAFWPDGDVVAWAARSEGGKYLAMRERLFGIAEEKKLKRSSGLAQTSLAKEFERSVRTYDTHNFQVFVPLKTPRIYLSYSQVGVCAERVARQGLWNR